MSSIAWKPTISSAACDPRTTAARSVIVLTDAGRETLERARRHHRHGIEQHFARHLDDDDVQALARALEKVSAHARPLRPGRIST